MDELESADYISFLPEIFLPTLKKSMKAFYGYFFCNKELVDVYIQYARENKMMFNILVMAKNNPLPACNSHHLRDLEYIVMIRQKKELNTIIVPVLMIIENFILLIQVEFPIIQQKNL